MRAFLLFCVVLFAGCGPAEERPLRHWRVKLVRPDGVVHAEYLGTRREVPWVRHINGGVMYVALDNRIVEAPTGWLLEVEELVEKQETDK